MDKQKAENEIFKELTTLKKSEALFRQIVEQLPFPIEVFSTDGTAIMVNKALLSVSGIPSADLIAGKYNILNDPYIEEKGLKSHIMRAFEGETVYFTDIKVPIKQLDDIYGIKNNHVISVYQDIIIFHIIIFPVFDEAGKVAQVVAFFKDQYNYNVAKKKYQ